MNLKIREFSEAIRKFVKENSLPTEAKRLALNEIAREVEQQAVEELLKEIEERERRENASYAEGV